MSAAWLLVCALSLPAVIVLRVACWLPMYVPAESVRNLAPTSLGSSADDSVNHKAHEVRR
eukprot:6181355-Pleurochrysis_carterae.AAC.1